MLPYRLDKGKELFEDMARKARIRYFWCTAEAVNNFNGI